MRRSARNAVRIAATMAVVALAISAIAASSASAFGIEGEWEAGTCKVESCTYKGGSPATEFFSQAAGHPNFGVTNFKVAAEGDPPKRVKVELPEGLNVNPQSVPQCPVETFKTNEAA